MFINQKSSISSELKKVSYDIAFNSPTNQLEDFPIKTIYI